MKSILIKNQTREFNKTYQENGKEYTITATARYDDRCGNGHNSFSITGQIWRTRNGKRFKKDCEICGCIHEDIARQFPFLKPFIKWHLVSSDGPMHYEGNALYHAGFTEYKDARNIDHLKSTIVYGVAPDDNMVNLSTISQKALKDFLRIRLPHVMEAFEKAMIELGFNY